MRTAEIYAFGKRAGTLTEGDDGRFVFLYDASYLGDPSAIAVSSTMPLATRTCTSRTSRSCVRTVVHGVLRTPTTFCP